MPALIFAIIVFILVIFLIDAGILLGVEKIFKIQNPTYKKALKTFLLSGFVGAVIAFIFSTISTSIVSTLAIQIASFYVFYYFLKKDYSSTWKKSLGIYIVFNIISIIAVLIIIIPIRTFVFSPFIVSGEAMKPLYNNGDYLLINHFNKSFERGDIVIIRPPQDPTKFYIKRIVGMPLEKLTIQNGKIFIDEQELAESYISVPTSGDITITLMKNEYYVLGDNRAHSSDSRSWGPITKTSIEGKVFYKVIGINK